MPNVSSSCKYILLQHIAWQGYKYNSLVKAMFEVSRSGYTKTLDMKAYFCWSQRFIALHTDCSNIRIWHKPSSVYTIQFNYARLLLMPKFPTYPFSTPNITWQSQPKTVFHYRAELYSLLIGLEGEIHILRMNMKLWQPNWNLKETVFEVKFNSWMINCIHMENGSGPQ